MSSLARRVGELYKVYNPYEFDGLDEIEDALANEPESVIEWLVTILEEVSDDERLI